MGALFCVPGRLKSGGASGLRPVDALHRLGRRRAIVGAKLSRGLSLLRQCIIRQIVFPLGHFLLAWVMPVGLRTDESFAIMGGVSISGQFINVVESQFRLESKNVHIRVCDSLARQPQSVYIE